MIDFENEAAKKLYLSFGFEEPPPSITKKGLKRPRY